MNTTVKSLQDVYVELGGELTDTYEDIANGVPVSDYTTNPDVIEAIAQIAGKSLELPKTTSADAGKLLVVNEDGDWDKGDAPEELPDVTASDNGSVLGVVDGAWAKKSTKYAKKEVTLETSGTTNIPFTDLEFIPNEEILLVFNATLSSTSGVVIINNASQDVHATFFKPVVEMIKVSDGYITKTESSSSVSNPSGISISGAGTSFTEGTVTLYYR